MAADPITAAELTRLKLDVAFLARTDISATARDVVQARLAALLVRHAAWLAEIAGVLLGADAGAVAGLLAHGFAAVRELEKTDPVGAANLRATIAAEVQRWHARDAVPLVVQP